MWVCINTTLTRLAPFSFVSRMAFCAFFILIFWTVDAGHWTIDAGHWTIDAGHWTIDAGHWTIDEGHLCRVYKVHGYFLLN